MEDTKFAIFIGVTTIITFGLGFWAGYTDIFGYIKSRLKKKKNFNTGYPAPPDNEQPNNGSNR